jgi:multidrug resistance protein, MATE family
MSFLKAIKEVIKLSLPMVIGQIGLMLIGAGDVYVASLYSTNSVAAIGVANGLINPIFLFGVGLMMGISPTISMRKGAGENKIEELSSILIYALITGLILTAIALFWNQYIPYLGLREEIVPSIIAYNKVVAWSFPFAVLFQALKEYLQASEKVIFTNLAAIIAVVLNLGLNALLVFGYADYKGIGEIGLAYASLIIRILLFLAVLFYTLRFEKLAPIKFTVAKKLFRFSLPIAIMLFLEVAAFCLVGILSGKISVPAAATNNLVMTMAAISFMIPLSLSSAISVKIGHAFGASQLLALKLYIKSALVLISIYVLLSSSLFFFFPAWLMGLVSKDPVVIEIGKSILFIVAIFQLSDCMQVTFSGILRGLKITRFSSYLVFIGYWIIGLPTGIYLTFTKNIGLSGLWIGLATALFLVAGSLAIYLKIEFKKIIIQMKLNNNDRQRVKGIYDEE